MNIDTTTYNKAVKYPYNPNKRQGWGGLRNTDIRAIIIHSTNGVKGSTFDNEARYLLDTTEVSAHYLIGKQGQVAQILDPKYIAWHSGTCFDKDYENLHSIGIETHWTVGEVVTPVMYATVNDLVRYLLNKYPSIKKVDMHRRQAYPKGRKPDPNWWSDADFDLWRSKLWVAAPVEPKPPITNEQAFTVIVDSAYIRQGPSQKYAISGLMSYGDTFTSIATKIDEGGIFISGVNVWYHITHGKHGNTDVSNLGFIHGSLVKPI